MREHPGNMLEIQTVYVYQMFFFFKPPHCALERPPPGFETAQCASFFFNIYFIFKTYLAAPGLHCNILLF